METKNDPLIPTVQPNIKLLHEYTHKRKHVLDCRIDLLHLSTILLTYRCFLISQSGYCILFVCCILHCYQDSCGFISHKVFQIKWKQQDPLILLVQLNIWVLPEAHKRTQSLGRKIDLLLHPSTILSTHRCFLAVERFLWAETKNNPFQVYLFTFQFPVNMISQGGYIVLLELFLSISSEFLCFFFSHKTLQ